MLRKRSVTQYKKLSRVSKWRYRKRNVNGKYASKKMLSRSEQFLVYSVDEGVG